MLRDVVHSPVARLVGVAAVALLAVGVIVLSALALTRVSPDDEPQEPLPVSTPGVPSSPDPSSEPTPEPLAAPGSAERFLSIGASSWWRATAGACGTLEPFVEYSSDEGASWSDVTPRYRGIAGVGSLNAFSAADVEMVALEGVGCEVHALRTYTYGRFWESYPDALGAAHYISFSDRATVMTHGGPVTAPCADAWGLRSSGETMALICAGAAWATTGGEWLALPSEGAIAVAVADGVVLVAMSGTSAAAVTGIVCEGVGIVRFLSAGAGAAESVACAGEADAAAPAALAVGPSSLVLWSGDQLLLL